MIAGSKIESIGVRLPEKSVATSDIINRLRVSKPIRLELLTGIAKRRVCSENEDSLTLAVDAVHDCLNHSKFEAKDIEMIICCSISRFVNGLNHYYEPPLSLLIKQKSGCINAVSLDISNACAGMMTGAYIANNFISRGVVTNCLVVSGEFITSISNNAEQRVDSPKHLELASLTVGDAGAAVILSQTENIEDCFSAFEMVTLSQYSDLCLGNQSTSFPGAVMRTCIKKIHEVSILNAPPLIENALKLAGLRMNQIDFLIPHQTAKASIQSGAKHFAQYFGEEPGEIVINLDETGNTASTTHFTTLCKYLNENRLKEGNKIMLVSFASGLVIGIAVFTIHDLVKKYGNNH
ncbi:MAG: 3-oxoacyl-ACP synthase [Bacteroidales bacterium]|nr:3-oxoacyl-ACP synthase [Bacteroidales bacterium]